MTIHFLGLAASLMSLLIWLPQMKHTWENRNDPKEMSAISTLTQVLLIANNILWILYGVRIPNGFWVWASSIVNIPVGIFTIYLINRAKHHLKNNPVAEAVSADLPEGAITSPDLVPAAA